MIAIRKYAAFKGSFALVTFVSKTVSNSNTRQSTWAIVLALATLGGATRNRNNPICVASPKVAKASK
jgi:hypothetical protein